MAERQELVAEDLLPIAIEYCNSKAFIDSIEQFQLTNAKRFNCAFDSKSTEDAEIPHEYHTLFVEYQALVDGLFEALAESRGFTTKALYRCFRDAGTFNYMNTVYSLVVRVLHSS